MIEYIEAGDIFELPGISNYAHGCNCAGAMGKGIALQFKAKYPKMYLQYKELCNEGKFKLGDVFDYSYDKGHIFNLATQKNWKTKADLLAIERSLKQMLSLAAIHGIASIALPKIGSGLGGLEWDNVKKVIEDVSKQHSDIKLLVVENYKKG